MTEPTQLKPCPFCGSAATMDQFESASWGGMLTVIGCGSSKCHMSPATDEVPVEMAITAWNARASDAEITRLTEALRAAEEQVKGLRGIVNGFIGLVISSGLTEDLVAQVFPDMKRKNGQPALTFAKNARRMVNEARQALKGPSHDA